MRIVKRGNNCEVIVREEPPYFEDYNLGFKLGLGLLYSKNRELVSIKFKSTYDDFEEFVPDIMPFRKYILTIGKEYKTPKICFDDFYEIDLCYYLELSYLMVLERMDSCGFDESEIRLIRRNFIKNWVDDGWPIDLERPIIESYYFNKKLYFYISSDSYYFSSFQEFIETFEKYLESFEVDDVEVTEKGERHAFISTSNKTYLLLYRGYDDEEDEEGKKFSKDEIYNLLKAKKESINIILGDYEVSCALEQEAIAWLKERGYEIKTIDEFMADYMFHEWGANDEYAKEFPEDVKELIESIFW